MDNLSSELVLLNAGEVIQASVFRLSAGWDAVLSLPEHASASDLAIIRGLLVLPDQADAGGAVHAAVNRGQAFRLSLRIHGTEARDSPASVAAVPVPGPDGAAAEWLCTLSCDADEEWSDQQVAGLAERQSFLLALSDAIQDLGAPHAIMHHAARTLGLRLDCGRVRYVDLDRARLTFAASAEWANADRGIDAVANRFSLNLVGQALIQDIMRGGVVWIEDVVTDPRTRENADFFLQFQVSSGLVVPLIKDGVLIAALTVHHPEPRHWSRHEIDLAREVAERTWSAVQQAKAELELQQTQAELRLALEVAGLGHWQLDLETCQLDASDEIKALFGCDPGVAMSQQMMADALHPDDRDGFRTALGQAIAERSGFDITGRCLAGGRIRWISLKGRFDPVDNHAGRLVGVGRDITCDRASAEARRLDAERLRLIIDSAKDYAILTADDDGIITSWNTGAERILGFSEEEAIGQHLRIFFSAEDKAAGRPEHEMEKARREGRAEDSRWHARKDGSLFWASGEMVPVQGEGISGFLKIFRDLTEQRRAEDRTRLLIAELNHRVKNTLGIVQSITHQSLRGTELDPAARRALDGRLQALSASHDLLTRSHWEGASLADVAQAALASVQSTARADVALSGGQVSLRPKAAVSLGLAIHELAANAASHGAFRDPAGRVELSWAATDGTLSFLWREQTRLAVAREQRRGFGTRFLEDAVPYELGGSARLALSPDGVEYRAEIPLQGNAA